MSSKKTSYAINLNPSASIPVSARFKADIVTGEIQSQHQNSKGLVTNTRFIDPKEIPNFVEEVRKTGLPVKITETVLEKASEQVSNILVLREQKRRATGDQREQRIVERNYTLDQNIDGNEQLETVELMRNDQPSNQIVPAVRKMFVPGKNVVEVIKKKGYAMFSESEKAAMIQSTNETVESIREFGKVLETNRINIEDFTKSQQAIVTEIDKINNDAVDVKLQVLKLTNHAVENDKARENMVGFCNAIAMENNSIKEQFNFYLGEQRQQMQSIIANQQTIAQSTEHVELMKNNFNNLVATATDNNKQVISYIESVSKQSEQQAALYNQSGDILKRFDDVNNQLISVNEQNEKIAQGYQVMASYFNGMEKQIQELLLERKTLQADPEIAKCLNRLLDEYNVIRGTLIQSRENVEKESEVIQEVVISQAGTSNQISELAGLINGLQKKIETQGKDIQTLSLNESIRFNERMEVILNAIKSTAPKPYSIDYEQVFQNEQDTRVFEMKLIERVKENEIVVAEKLHTLSSAIKQVPGLVNKANLIMLNAMKGQIRSYTEVMDESINKTNRYISELAKAMHDQQEINVQNRLLNNQPLIVDFKTLNSPPRYAVFSNKNLAEAKPPSRDEILGLIGTKSLSSYEGERKRTRGNRHGLAIVKGTDPDPFVNPGFHRKKHAQIKKRRIDKANKKINSRNYSMRKILSLL